MVCLYLILESVTLTIRFDGTQSNSSQNKWKEIENDGRINIERDIWHRFSFTGWRERHPLAF